jgi:hypothetical protein
MSGKRPGKLFLLYRKNGSLEIHAGLLKRRGRLGKRSEKKAERIAKYGFYPVQIRDLPDWQVCPL